MPWKRHTRCLRGILVWVALLVLAACPSPTPLEMQKFKDARPFVPRSEVMSRQRLNAAADFETLLAALEGEEPRRAARAAMAMGVQKDPRALPPLVEALGHGDPSVRFAAAASLQQFGEAAVAPLTAAAADGPPAVRIGAIETLGGIGGADSVPPLISVFRSEAPDRVRMAAAESMVRIADPSVIPPLIAEMTDAGSNLRYASADALADLGEPAVEPLIGALGSADAEQAWIVADTLGRIGDSRAAQPLLGRLGAAETEAVRMSVVRALGKIGDPAAVPALAARMRDPVSVVRSLAADAMVEMGEAAVEPLVSMLGAEDPEVQDRAADALARIGRPAVEPLLGALADTPSDMDREWALIATLGAIGDRRATGPIARYLDHPNPDLALAAVEALGNIGSQPPPVPEAAEAGAEGEGAADASGSGGSREGPVPSETRQAVEGPAEGPQAGPAEPAAPPGPTPVQALSEALRSRTETLGLAASEAMVRIGPPAAGALVTALESDHPQVRRLSAGALVKIGGPAVAPLLAALRGEDAPLAETAAAVLTSMGEAAVGPLSVELTEADPSAQRRIADVLTGIGSPEAVGAVVAALKDWSSRRTAAKALQAAGWKPSTPEERVRLLVAEDRREALLDQWRVTRYVLSKDLTSGDARDAAYAVRAWLAVGNEASIPEMVAYVEESENQDTARLLLESGEPRLERAARSWYRSQQLDPDLLPPPLPGDPPPVRWGEMVNP